MPETTVDVDRLANYFVSYLFDEYKGTRHVRRVATWIGFLIKAVERASGGSIQLSRTRQVTFDYRGHKFKVRFNHKTGRKGGLQIVEVLELQGQPDGDVVAEIRDLAEAEGVYRSLEARLDECLADYDKPLPRLQPR